MDNDTLYVRGLDDTPAIKACLIHADRACIKTFEATTTRPGYSGVTYGLCTACMDSLAVDGSYAHIVGLEIDKRLRTLTMH